MEPCSLSGIQAQGVSCNLWVRKWRPSPVPPCMSAWAEEASGSSALPHGAKPTYPMHGDAWTWARPPQVSLHSSYSMMLGMWPRPAKSRPTAMVSPAPASCLGPSRPSTLLHFQALDCMPAATSHADSAVCNAPPKIVRRTTLVLTGLPGPMRQSCMAGVVRGSQILCHDV